MRTLMLTTMLLAGCDALPVGPEGPAGMDGAAGPAGPAGPAGSIDLVTSAWFDTETEDWTRNDIDTDHIEFTYDIAAPEITAAVLDGGMVEVYGNLAGYNEPYWIDGDVGRLPITLTYPFFGDSMVDVWSARITEGTVTIHFINSDALFDTVAGGHQFRYVVVPPAAE